MRDLFKMKTLLNFTFFLLFVISATNCTNTETLEDNRTFNSNETNEKLDFSNIEFSSISFNFSKEDALVIEHKDAFTRKLLFINKLNELIDKTKRDKFSEKDYLGLNFSVSLINNKYTIYPEKFIFSNALCDKKSVGTTCPKGMNKHKTCRTSSCVKNTLAIYAEVMSSGDSFSVHYGTFGVRICANSGLIEKAKAHIIEESLPQP